MITTEELATDSIQSVFAMIFGSYFGDWDSPDNLLRAALASGTVLTNAWAGRPKYQFQHMSLGENIGYGIPLTQNTATNFVQDTCYGGRLVHVSLMGDPTLRMHIVAPPGEGLTLSEEDGNVLINWTASADADLGYHIYRKEVSDTFFERLNEEPVNEVNYTDECVTPNIEYVYMVRALRLETSASGSYYNLSQGIKENYTLSVGCLSALSEKEEAIINLSPVPADDFIHVEISNYSGGTYMLELLNKKGQVILEKKSSGAATTQLSTAHLPGGVYWLVLRKESGIVSTKKVIII